MENRFHILGRSVKKAEKDQKKAIPGFQRMKFFDCACRHSISAKGICRGVSETQKGGEVRKNEKGRLSSYVGARSTCSCGRKKLKDGKPDTEPRLQGQTDQRALARGTQFGGGIGGIHEDFDK